MSLLFASPLDVIFDDGMNRTGNIAVAHNSLLPLSKAGE